MKAYPRYDGSIPECAYAASTVAQYRYNWTRVFAICTRPTEKGLRVYLHGADKAGRQGMALFEVSDDGIIAEI